MTLLVLLDTGPLGMVTHPKGGPETRQAKVWLQELLETGATVAIPAIADYELRRELERSGSRDQGKGLDRLEELLDQLPYLAIDRETMREAARFWATARAGGRPTAPNSALDGDCILPAQAILAPTRIDFTREERVAGISTVIATTNPRHLERYAPAQLWSDIRP